MRSGCIECHSQLYNVGVARIFPRSEPIQVLIYSALTLGLYDLVWITRTQTIMQSAGMVIRRPKAMGFIKCMQAVCLLISFILLYTVFLAPGMTHSRVPSQECMFEFSIKTEKANPYYKPMSDDCKRQYDEYYRQVEASTEVAYGFFFVLVFGLVLPPIYMLFAKGWYDEFCSGIEKLTDGRVESRFTALMLGYFPVGIGIALLQYRLNALPDSKS
jgi:hypothetical protein